MYLKYSFFIDYSERGRVKSMKHYLGTLSWNTNDITYILTVTVKVVWPQ